MTEISSHLPCVQYDQGAWWASYGSHDIPCATEWEALHHAKLLGQKQRCVYRDCVDPQVDSGRWHLHMCARHTRKAARTLSVDIPFKEEYEQ